MDKPSSPASAALMPDLSRRDLLSLMTAGSAAAWVGAFPKVALAQIGKPEVTAAKLGFIALTDAAPLLIAKEKGLFAKYGVGDVEVLKQASWPGTRDNLELGSANGGIDGAHILTPMPYLMTVGRITKNNQPVPMVITARLNTNGQGITVENKYLAEKVNLNAATMRPVIAKRRAEGKELKAAMTFPGGTHDLWLRYWLAAGGIDPNKDLDVIPIPPPQMVANMKADTMEAYCVGEPWNDAAVDQKVGYTAVSTGQLWMNHPEKVLSFRADFVAKHPNTVLAITAAIIEAQIWCDTPANQDELCRLIAVEKYLRVNPASIADRIKGNFIFGDGRVQQGAAFAMKFFKDAASFPFKSHDLWFLTEDQRWGYLPTSLDPNPLIARINRDDIWRQAAMLAKVPANLIPKASSRGVERFFDGKTFDPKNPKAYLASLPIKKLV
jgi:nitrate/nitrite transport system substrate-binding protein